MELIEITAEVHKVDRRTKIGWRLVLKKDHSVTETSMLKHTYRTTYPPSQGYRVEFHPTWIDARNAITGETFKERYDTPWSCSARSESYWCN